MLQFLPVVMILGSLAALGPTQEELPRGSAPPALVFDHFPSRLHAYVFRNWHLVAPDRLGKVIGASREQIETVAGSMGLPAAVPIPGGYHERMYITLLRRNWHLLPYEQLLELLQISSSELARRLKDDDFLFIKLGNLKPAVTALRYQEPSPAEQARCAEIKELLQRHFGESLAEPGESRFAFIRELSQPPNEQKHTEPVIWPVRSPRYLHSYFATFGDPLADEQNDPYPEGLLARLARLGVTGVWLHVTLSELAPGGKDFPEFGQGHERRLAHLRALVARAKRHGMEVYLYLNEPRAMPRSFFARRQEMVGVATKEYVCLCTSDARVTRWLQDATAHVFREVPDLGGVFTITASENQTNCAWSGHAESCPRCSKRTQAEIVAEVNGAIEKGVHSAAPKAKVMIWDWGWNGHRDGTEHIRRHRGDYWLQSVSEWDAPFERGGVHGRVGEYSLSVTGPGPRALRHWAEAKKLGFKTLAKVQLGTTWELGSVPYLPVGDLVAEHCLRLKKAGTDGLMLSWSLGGFPSPNLRIAQLVFDDGKTDADEILQQVCVETYGAVAGPLVRSAWRQFSAAFRQFPYCGSLLYQGPQHFGPANLLYAKPTRYGATMLGFPYDDINAWRGPYSVDQMAGLLEKLDEIWKNGEGSMELAWQRAEPEFRDIVAREKKLAQAIRLHFLSTAHQLRFTALRERALQEKDDERKKQLGVKMTQQLAEMELGLAKDLYTLVKADARLGYESTNQYLYMPLDLAEKVVNCDWIMRNMQP